MIDLTDDALGRECLALREQLRDQFRAARSVAALWEPRPMPAAWRPRHAAIRCLLCDGIFATPDAYRRHRCTWHDPDPTPPRGLLRAVAA